MRRGKIKDMNPARGMIGILTDDDGYTIIELLSDDVFEVGDELTWEDDYEMGHAMYRNVTKGFLRFQFQAQRLI